jgi:hypothetical protein
MAITPTITYNVNPVIIIQCVGITYNQFLNTLGTFIYGIEEIYISSNSLLQVSQIMNFNTFDANGNQMFKIIPFPIDSYQFQASKLIETNKDIIYLNQNSSLIFNVLANTQVYLKLLCVIAKSVKNEIFDEFNDYSNIDFFNNYCNVIL